jgi:acylphosphatase
MAGGERVVRHVTIRGRVQGVGFRAWTEQEALDLGLEGWVRNRRDGSVECVFAGPASLVETMIEACRRGPPAARIDHIATHEGTADLLGQRTGFGSLPTL